MVQVPVGRGETLELAGDDIALLGLVLGVAVHDVHLGVARRVAHGRVDVKSAKVSHNIALGVGTDVFEVLVTEDEHAALGSKKRQVVEPFFAEGGELYALCSVSDRHRDICMQSKDLRGFPRRMVV